MKVALIQFNAGADKQDNLRRAKAMVINALQHKAQWVLLPETFHLRADLKSKELRLKHSEKIPGATTQEFLKIAQEYRANLLLGSILEKAPSSMVYNTAVVLHGSSGKIEKYRKIHLFEARLGDKMISESSYIRPGQSPCLVKVGEFKVGVSICYDLRFAELYRSYAQRGANVMVVPSCFTKQTGRAHWKCLLKARAIENLSYVMAPNQVGRDAKGIEAYGHSMIIDPWGKIIAEGSSDKEEILYAQISLEKVNQSRARLPGIV